MLHCRDDVRVLISFIASGGIEQKGQTDGGRSHLGFVTAVWTMLRGGYAGATIFEIRDEVCLDTFQM